MATQCFFSKLSLFVPLFLENQPGSLTLLSAGEFSSTRKFMILGLLAIKIFNFLMAISRGIIFRKESSLFSKMVQATNGPFLVSLSSLTRKMVPVFGVTPYQNKNRNRSMDQVQNVGKERR